MDHLPDLLDSWRVHMQAERKSKGTIRLYLWCVNSFAEWCKSRGREVRLDQDAYRAYSAHLVEQDNAPTYIRTIQNGLRQFSAWLADEGETDGNLLASTRLAKGDAPAVQPYSEDELRALLDTCKPGKDAHRGTIRAQQNLMIARRDEAVIRLLSETMIRANELMSLTVDAVDISKGVALVVRGKGGKGRFVPFGSQTARALDRYKRERRAHRLADTPALWLGANSNGWSYPSLWLMIGRRAEQAGVPAAHPHRFRHTGATRWLKSGGSEGGLMAIAGWSNREMMARYVRATASERALDESRDLNLGDL